MKKSKRKVEQLYQFENCRTVYISHVPATVCCCSCAGGELAKTHSMNARPTLSRSNDQGQQLARASRRCFLAVRQVGLSAGFPIPWSWFWALRWRLQSIISPVRDKHEEPLFRRKRVIAIYSQFFADLAHA